MYHFKFFKGMPPLTSAELVDKETPKTNIKPVDGAYYYKRYFNTIVSPFILMSFLILFKFRKPEHRQELG